MQSIMNRERNFPQTAFIAKNATIIGDIVLQKDVNIWYGAVIRADKDKISIGERSNIQDNSVVHTSKGFSVTIGEDVSVGHGAILHGCSIGDCVLVGMGSIILNGASIGKGSIVGAGAVITEGKIIPPGSLVLGLPGKVIREVTDEEFNGTLYNASEYVKLAKVHADA
jgi:carbonic anhydrase/acetyltransferase-like protein (isoleucine patch superfamily)